MTPKTVLITGIGGFIAKRLAADLLAAGHVVTGSLRDPDRAGEVRGALAARLGADPGERLRFVTLDLTADAGWTAAAAGADVMMHTASPFPLVQPRDPETLARPAVDGTLRALRAARDAGVGRVILTSSLVAVMYTGGGSGVRGPGDWTDPEGPGANPYDRSKTLAERAAWDFAAAHPAIALTTVNPGLVAGRPIDARHGTSLDLIDRFLAGRDPALPNFGVPVVDVGDVAALHVAAMGRPETAGKRLLAAEAFLTVPEMARMLAAAYPDRRIATRVAPNWAVRLLSRVDPTLRTVVPNLGLRLEIDTSETRALTGIAFRPAADAILDSAAYLTARAAA